MNYTIEQFITRFQFEMSDRLKNLLRNGFTSDRLISTITNDELDKIRQFGKKSKIEFRDLEEKCRGIYFYIRPSNVLEFKISIDLVTNKVGYLSVDGLLTTEAKDAIINELNRHVR